PGHRAVAENDETVDDNPLGDDLIAGKLYVAACIIRAVARHVDGAARRLEGCALQLRCRKFDAAADRGAIRERAGQLEQLVAELTRRRGAVDHGPVDYELLRTE